MAADEKALFFSKLWTEFENTKTCMKRVISCVTGGKNISSATAEELKDKLGGKMDMAEIIKNLWTQLEANYVIMQKTSDEIERLKIKENDNLMLIKKLQNNIIESNDKKTDDFSKIVNDNIATTLKKEIRQYNEVVKSNLSEKTPTNVGGIKSAVKNAMMDMKKETDRKKSVVVFGLQEEESENLTETTGDLLEKINVTAVIQQAYRIGRKNDERIRPLRIVLSTIDSVHDFLYSAKQLRHSEKYKSVYVSIDRNPKEIVEHRNLVIQLKKKILEFPNRFWYIKNNNVLSTERKSSVPTETND